MKLSELRAALAYQEASHGDTEVTIQMLTNQGVVKVALDDVAIGSEWYLVAVDWSETIQPVPAEFEKVFQKNFREILA